MSRQRNHPPRRTSGRTICPPPATGCLRHMRSVTLAISWRRRPSQDLGRQKCCRAQSSKARMSSSDAPATSRRRSSTRWAPARWAPIQWRWWTLPSRFMVLMACVSSTPRSCQHRLRKHELAGHHDCGKSGGGHPPPLDHDFGTQTKLHAPSSSAPCDGSGLDDAFQELVPACSANVRPVNVKSRWN